MPYILSDKISDFNGSNDEKTPGASAGWPLHPSAPEEELQLQAPQGAQPCDHRRYGGCAWGKDEDHLIS